MKALGLQKKFIRGNGYAILLLISMLTALSFAQSNRADPAIDRLPRNRLVSNAELFALLDFSAPGLAAVQTALQHHDTTLALQKLGAYFLKRTKPTYFFDPQRVTERVSAFAKTYPEAARQVCQRADAFMKIYGADVIWKQPGTDQLGRAHTPNTIRFLARQARARDIALSYWLSGETRYREFLLAQIRDFVQDYQNGETESGRNDVFERFYAGHRTRNWLFADHLLRNADASDWQTRVLMLKVFLMHGARLIDACINFHWGNHQLHGLAGLYEMSLMYPELPVMHYWNREALRVIMEHISREIKPDGFQFERASHYFKLDIINYFRTYRISQLNNVTLPPLFEQRFHKMFDAIVALAKPDLRLPVLQDAQAIYGEQRVAAGDSAGIAENNDAAELADPGEADFMSLGAALFRNPVYKFFGAQQFPADFYWFFDENIVLDYPKIPNQQPAIGSVALDSSRYYVMRSGWDKDALYLIIDGGLAKYKPDHTHGGVLGVIAHAFGEELLPTYRVRYSDPSYRTMKNSRVKNVAIVDNVLQGQEWISNHARTGFGIWRRLPRPTVHDWFSGQRFDYFSGSHNAYDSLGVHYSRAIIFFKPFGWLVADKFTSDDLHNYQQTWQGSYQFDDQYNRALKTGERAQLHILQSDPSRMEIAGKQNFWTEALQFEKRGEKNYTFFTLLYPQSNVDKNSPDIRLFERDTYQQVVAFAGDQRHSLYFKKLPELSLDEISTDAEMVAVSYEADSLYAVLLHNGHSLKMDGIALQSERALSLEAVRNSNGNWELRLLKGKKQKIRLNNKEQIIKH